MPLMILTSVLLPAPLSPHSATISPAWTVSETPSSDWSPPNHLTMSTQRSTGLARTATALERCSCSTVTCPLRPFEASGPERPQSPTPLRTGDLQRLLPRRHLRRLHGTVLVLEVLLVDVVVGGLERVEGDRLEALRLRR